MTVPDAIELLLDDHERLSRTLADLEGSLPGRRRARLIGELHRHLAAHFRSEETVFYPTCQEFVLTRSDHDAFDQCGTEHRNLLRLLKSLNRGGNGSREGSARPTSAFCEALERHIRWEEQTLFPLARRGLARSDLVEVARRMSSRARRTLGGPRARQHHAAPSSRGHRLVKRE